MNSVHFCLSYSIKSLAVAEMDDRGHNKHGPKRRARLGAITARHSSSGPFAGELGPRLTEWARAEVYFRTKWRLHPFSRLATIDMNRKLGNCAAFSGVELGPHLMGRKLGVLPPFWEKAGSPSNRKSPGLRPTSVPSGILMHPTVWSQ